MSAMSSEDQVYRKGILSKLTINEKMRTEHINPQNSVTSSLAHKNTPGDTFKRNCCSKSGNAGFYRSVFINLLTELKSNNKAKNDEQTKDITPEVKTPME